MLGVAVEAFHRHAEALQLCSALACFATFALLVERHVPGAAALLVAVLTCCLAAGHFRDWIHGVVEQDGDGAEADPAEEDAASDAALQGGEDEVGGGLPRRRPCARRPDPDGAEELSAGDLSLELWQAERDWDIAGGQQEDIMGADVAASLSDIFGDAAAAAGKKDAVSKARLDLLLRYMAAAEGGGEAGPPCPAPGKGGSAALRQKLQRKLLQRSTTSKGGATAEAEGGDARGAALASDAEKDALQEKEKMEEFLREFGELDATSKAGADATRAAKSKQGRRGRQAQKVRPKSDAHSLPEEAVLGEGAPDVPHDKSGASDSAASGVSTGAPDEAAAAEVPPGEAGLDEFSPPRPEEGGCFGEGFQVVANRKARKKGRRGSGGGTAVDIGGEAAGEDGDGAGLGAAEGEETVSAAVGSSPAAGRRTLGGHAEGAIGQAGSAEDDVAEDQEWEWQCPDGHRLESRTCAKPTRCSSCGKMQLAGSSVLQSAVSQWVACQECIGIAMEQPVERSTGSGAGSASGFDTKVSGAVAPCPERMSAVEIAQWLQQRGAEEALRRCMQEVLSAQGGAAPRK